MPPRIEELVQAVVDVSATMKEVIEGVAAYKDRVDAQLKAVARDAAASKAAAEAIETELARPFFRVDRGSQRATAEEDRAFQVFARHNDGSGLKAVAVKAAMTTGVDPEGGVLVPTWLQDGIMKRVHPEHSLAGQAKQTPVPFGVGDSVTRLRSNNAATSGWVSETGARDETATSQLAEIKTPLHELYASPKVSQRNLDDASFDVTRFLEEEIGEAFSSSAGAAYISGNGVGKPRGIATYPVSTAADATRAFGTVQVILTGVDGAFPTPTVSVNGGDILLNAIYALKPVYRKDASWLMSSTTLAAARKLKDSDGAFLWRPGLESGQPSTLLGYPVFEDENMPAIATDALSIAFGAWKRAYEVLTRPIAMLRDPFTNKPFVVFYSTIRLGGDAIDTEAYKLIKFGDT